MALQWFDRAAIFLSFFAAAISAQAVDFDSARIAPESEWRVIVSPYVWAASLKGDAQLAGQATDVDVPFHDIFDHLDFALMGNVEVTNGQWGVYFDGQHVRTTQDEEVFHHQLGLGIETTILSAGAFYRLYEEQLGGTTVFGVPRRLSIEPTVGVRWTRLKATVDAGFFATTKRADWTDPFVGLRLSADLDDRWTVNAEADVGGFDIGSKLSINAQAYLGYRTYMGSMPTILRIGYRALSQDYEGDDFTGNKFRWDVTQHGPVVGLSIRF
jgi:hypothetical protein